MLAAASGAGMSVESHQASDTTSVPSHIESLGERDDDEAIPALSARIGVLERQLRDQPRSKITPRMLTVIGSVIAAVIPLTTAIDGYLKWRADLAVTAQQQLHAARMDSLKTVLSAQLPELERESRLRLLLAMLEPDDAIHAWAAAELSRVEKTVKVLEDEKAAAQQEREAWEQKAAEAAAKIEAKQGTTLAELIRGLNPPALAPAEPGDDFGTSAAAMSGVKPGSNGKKPPGKLAPELALKLPPEALEYRQAKRMSEAAETKVNVRARRLLGADFY
jgi:hypothetical protein